MSAFKYSNRGGIPCLKSTSAVVIDSTLMVSFPEYTNVPKNFSGLIAINIAQSFTAANATTVDIILGNQTFQLMKNNDTAASGTQIAGTGVYLTFMDNASKTLYYIG